MGFERLSFAFLFPAGFGARRPFTETFPRLIAGRCSFTGSCKTARRTRSVASLASIFTGVVALAPKAALRLLFALRPPVKFGSRGPFTAFFAWLATVRASLTRG